MNELVFVNMATAEALPGENGELMKRMKAFAEALRSKPGLVNVYVLREDGTENFVGLSIWADKASFDSGMASVLPLPSKVAVTKHPPVVRQFKEA